MKFSTDDLLKLCMEFNDTRLTSIVSDTRDAEFDFYSDPSYLTDIDYIIEVGDWFYSQFCKTCKPIQCNYCPAYAWHSLTGYDEKVRIDEAFKEENKEILCSEKCENCIHEKPVELFNWYIEQEIITICSIDCNPSSCNNREVVDINQMTLADLTGE